MEYCGSEGVQGRGRKGWRAGKAHGARSSISWGSVAHDEDEDENGARLSHDDDKDESRRLVIEAQRRWLQGTMGCITAGRSPQIRFARPG